MNNEEKITASPVRLPLGLKQWLKHRAIDNHRSFNSEVVERLAQSRQSEESKRAAAN